MCISIFLVSENREEISTSATSTNSNLLIPTSTTTVSSSPITITKSTPERTISIPTTITISKHNTISNYQATTIDGEELRTTTQIHYNSRLLPVPIVIAVVIIFAIALASVLYRFRNQRSTCGIFKQRKPAVQSTSTAKASSENRAYEVIIDAKSNNPVCSSQALTQRDKKKYLPMKSISGNMVQLKKSGMNDVDADGYVIIETIPKNSTDINGYEVPINRANTIQELNGYVVMQSMKAKPFSTGSNIEISSATNNFESTCDPSYETIKKISH